MTKEEAKKKKSHLSHHSHVSSLSRAHVNVHDNFSAHNEFDESAEKTDWSERCGFDCKKRRYLFPNILRLNQRCGIFAGEYRDEKLMKSSRGGDLEMKFDIEEMSSISLWVCGRIDRCGRETGR